MRFFILWHGKEYVLATKDEREKLEEQQDRFDVFELTFGENLAYFYCCVQFDKPFDLTAIPADEPKYRWLAYLDNLKEKRLDKDKYGTVFGFLDGLTDVGKIFGDISTGEFRKAIWADKTARMAGSERQRKVWGTGGGIRPYSDEDYAELDRIYNILSADLEAAGGVSAKQEMILRRCSERTLDMTKAESRGDYDKAAKISKLIDSDLASENLRKKDAKPVEDFRVDSWADSLEKAGLMKKGKRCSPDEMFQILFGRPPKYPYTKDAAEQMILICENRARINDGMPELSVLPDEMRLTDELGEFAEEPNARELDVYDKLGLVKMPPPGTIKDGES